MLGAIKRRWKSKKVKVLNKGGDLSSSHDACPASRGFVDEDFEKTVKPPSPRQIHPLSETSMEVVSTKYSNSPHSHHKSGNITAKTKSSTLPSSDEPCPFIRVNSGRIELVNSTGRDNSRHHGSPHYHLPHPPFPEILSEKLRRRLGGRLRNDSRHSWCGGSGGSREPGRIKGSSGLVLSSQPPDQQCTQFPVSEKQRLVQNQNQGEVDPTYSDPIEENQIIRLRTSLLQERLDALETLTKNCQNWQKEEKKETEAWITDLTSQVTRALTFQQLMKSEVEKLQERVFDLETHNRAMATMIVPTLMKLQEAIGKGRAEVGRGSESEIPQSPQTKMKGKTMNESWSPTSTVHGPQSLKDKKIDCRIPRINSRLNRTKHQQEQEKHDGGGDSSSSPDLTPPFSRLPNALPRLNSPPSKALPKSKSSLTTSIHSKIGSISTVTSSQNKSSTFSGIPRMSSPRPNASGEVTSTSGERRGSGTRKVCSPSGSSGGSGSRNGASNHKNDSPKTPCHDLHSNSSGSSGNAGSRLPILRKTVFPFQSPKSTKTNPSKVSSVIHHQNQATFVGSSGSNNTPISGQTSSPSGTVACSGGLTLGKPLGKDEGYSTMSSEALVEQEGSSKTLLSGPIVTNDKDITTTIPKSNTFSTFHHHNFPPSGTDGSSGGGPLPKQLITKMGRDRNWASLPKSANPVNATSSSSSVVRIVRGISGAVSYEIEPCGGDEGALGGARRMTMEEPSSSTILWEDSDDSDILFLPLELSTTSPASSSPTLVPPSWPSSATPRLPSSTSFSNSSTVTNGSTQERSQRKTSGEASRPTPWVVPDQDEVQVEERALIEKWMRLEDGRNQVHWEDEWAWDWDGVERVQVQKTTAAKKFNTDLRLPEFWTCSKNLEAEESELNSPGRAIQIDSSTWTKSKSKGKSTNQKNNRTESAFIVAEPVTNKQKELIVTNKTQSAVPSMTETDVISALKIQEAMVTEAPSPSPPPVIEFTPAFYHLVKYGSSSSVNDNQQLNLTSKVKSPTKIKTKEFISFSSSDEEGPGSACGKMDDKISQTDFGSSLENLSVSSELFTECRNCLELIKRLVGGIDEVCGVGSSGLGDNTLKEDNFVTTLDRDRDNLQEETLVTDNGAPTTWISVPRGLPTTEVDRILEILSSSESEDVLSPQSSHSKEK